jgi:hypothetical protein
MTHRRLLFLIVGLAIICFSPTTISAQTDNSTCPAIVQDVLQTVDQLCSGAGRNEACYGNLLLSATPRSDVAEFIFESPGDIAKLVSIESMQLTNMDVDNETWGVVLFRAQANLPDTLPGQNVTFLLFGDVSITNSVDPDDTSLKPMQAFYFNTGIGDRPCQEAPDSGILVQTPQGMGTVHLNANGADIALGSTALFETANGFLEIFMLDGAGVIEIDGVEYIIPAGTVVQIPIDDDGNIIGPPGDPQPYDLSDLLSLPIELLPQVIEIHEPLTEEQIRNLLNPPTTPPPIVDNLPVPGECLTHWCLEGQPWGDGRCNDPDPFITAWYWNEGWERGCVGEADSHLNPDDCDVHWCFEGQPWGDGRCNDPDPDIAAWHWWAGWQFACYEAGYISDIPDELLTPLSLFNATFSCFSAGIGQIDYVGAIPGETLTYELYGCSLFTLTTTTATGTSGSFTFSCLASTPIPDYIQNMAGDTITFNTAGGC